MLEVSIVTPESARAKGPAAAMQSLGEVALVSEVMGQHAILLADDESGSSHFVSLDVGRDIKLEHAEQLQAGMKAYLVGENQRPLRSENLATTFERLVGVVDNGCLFLTRPAAANPSPMSLS